MKGDWKMKTFETPFVDVKKFDVMDVLTTSGGATPVEEEEEDPVMFGNCI
jgi:hypothetical protein